MTEEMTFVIEKLYPYFWRKFGFLAEDDTDTDCEEWITNLREAVWVHRIVSLWHWRPFLDANESPMTFSPETYVSYMFFMISTTIKDLPNIHESFITSCSLVTAVAAYLYNKRQRKFLEYCPDILKVFFEDYSKVSDKVQLRDHLSSFCYSEAYKRVEQRTEGNPFADVVNDFHFVVQIKEMIKSNIYVGTLAAVHCYTAKVMEHFKTTTSRNRGTISKWNVGSQTEWSFGNMEDQRKSESGQIISEEHIERIALKLSQLLPDIVNRLLDVFGGVIRLGDTEVIEMKQGLSSKFEKGLQCLKTLRKSEAEQSSVSSKHTEAVSSKQISSSPLEMSLQDATKQEISENKQSFTPVEDNEAPFLKISSFYSVVQSIQDVEKSGISNSEEITSMAESEAVISKRNSPVETEQSFQEDLKKLRISKREQSLSALEETGNIKLEQISSFQSEEESLQNNMNKLTISNDKQSTSFLLSCNNFNSDDCTSQFGAENTSEENYSDTLHDTEAANQNTAQQSKQKPKKRNRKRKKAKDKKSLKEQSSAKVEDEAIDLRISSYSEEQSFQSIEKQRDNEASLPVPSKQEVLHVLLFLIQKLKNSFRSVCNLLDVTVDN